ncbi:MAG: hypothetical protein QOJ72_2427, partial [Nocardioidaceae bacterium]|nr:hypothetical protein [Nocardioidaceae bacterium]
MTQTTATLAATAKGRPTRRVLVGLAVAILVLYAG